MQPALQPGDPTASIMNAQGPTGPYQVQTSPDAQIGPAGSPNLQAIQSLGMLAMLA